MYRVQKRLALFFSLIALFAIQLPARAAYITGVTAQATSSQVFQANVLTTDAGLTETTPGSGVYQLTTNSYAGGGAMWNSAYIAYGPDENPYVQFDLGATYTVNKFHIWNFNGQETFRGFRQVTVQTSANGTTWKSVAQRFVFAKAPGVDTYTGEDYAFTYPVSARYIRFIADSTYRNFPQRELAGLGKVRFQAGGTVVTPPATGGIFPSDSGVINVKLPPYNAVGDGEADDSDALQNAINDWQGTSQTIYLPAGTYKVTRSISLSHNGYGFTNIRGESASKTTIVLADNTFTDANNPHPVLSAANNRGPGGISADWFNNNFGFFTISVGTGNPGAVGLQFYSNNVGSVRNVNFTSEDGGGKIALDLGYDDQNGPLLVKNVNTYGYGTGVNAGYSVNSQVLENIKIDSPAVVGIQNGGQCLSIRNYRYNGSVPALNNSGFAVLIAANLNNTGCDDIPAVVNNEGLFARSLTVTGFYPTIQNNSGGTANATTASIAQFVSHPILSQFSTRLKSLKLPVKETPEPPTEGPATWANVRNFRLVTDPDDTAAIQRAIDSGATTVYFPSQGTYWIGGKVYLRNKVQRIVGMQAAIFRAATGGGFQVEAGTPTTVWLEQIGGFYNTLDLVNNSTRTLVGRDLQDPNFTLTGTGDLFLENVSTGPLTVSGQKVWARQLNIEGAITKVTNNGGTFWTLGFKSEDGGTLIATNSGGKSELLGGLYYSRTGDLAPMFTNSESSVSVSLAEVNFSSNPFSQIVRETRGGVTRTLTKAQTPQRNGVPGSMLPLYVGYYDAAYLAPPYNALAVGGNQQIALSWDAMPGATAYIVRRATSAAGPYTTLTSTLTTNSYTNTGLAANKTYYYTLAAKYAGGTSAYTSPVSATTNPIAVYQINCGGGADAPYSADQFGVGGNTAGTGSPIDTTGVIRPAPQSVYQSERWGDHRYDITGLTPGASYQVRLHFAEFVVGGAGQRVFNVNINSSAFLTNFDIIAATGGINRAIVKETTATADSSGKISIAFVSVVASAKVSGIEILLP